MTSTTNALQENKILLSTVNVTVRELRAELDAKANNMHSLKCDVDSLTQENSEFISRVKELEREVRALTRPNDELTVKYEPQCCENKGLDDPGRRVNC